MRSSSGVLGVATETSWIAEDNGATGTSGPRLARIGLKHVTARADSPSASAAGVTKVVFMFRSLDSCCALLRTLDVRQRRFAVSPTVAHAVS